MSALVSVTHGIAQRVAVVLATAAIAAPAHARAEPATAVTGPAATAPTEPPPTTTPPEQAWDEALGTTPAPAQPAAPLQAPTESAPVPLPPPTAQQLEDMRRTGNGLLIGAGVTAIVATLLNGLRVYVVTGPCQTDAQTGCSLGWFVATPFVFGTNIASAALAGTGARERGTADVWLKPNRVRSRSAMMLSLGIPLIAIGFAASVSLRALWLGDYGSPGGVQVFDFARPSHAFGYYGAQQLSALAFAAGIGMVSYHMAGKRERRRYNMAASPWMGPSFAGLQLRSRF